MNKIKFPIGKAQVITLTPAAGAASVTIENTLAVVKTGTLDAALTLTMNADAELPIGSTVLVVASSDGTGRNVTFAGSALGIAISGTASKTKTKLFVWDGTNFLGISGEQVN